LAHRGDLANDDFATRSARRIGSEAHLRHGDLIGEIYAEPTHVEAKSRGFARQRRDPKYHLTCRYPRRRQGEPMVGFFRRVFAFERRGLDEGSRDTRSLTGRAAIDGISKADLCLVGIAWVELRKR